MKSGKMSLAIGGEHTITLGVMRSFDEKVKKTAIVNFDAQLDLRNEFLGLILSHTTFMQPINEELKPVKIIKVGRRLVSEDELK